MRVERGDEAGGVELELMGEPDPDGLIAARLSGESPFTSTISIRSGVSACVKDGLEFQSTLVTFSVSNCTSSYSARLSE